jgi:hypothetical protein
VAVPVIRQGGGARCYRAQDSEEIRERVTACDVGKAELVCCVRVPDEERPGRRLQEVEAYSTMTRSLLGMVGRLACLGVIRVVMEATSDYCKPVFHLLEAARFETWLVNAKVPAVGVCVSFCSPFRTFSKSRPLVFRLQVSVSGLISSRVM